MTPPPAFVRLIAIVQTVLDLVVTRDDLHVRPSWARQAVAVRLKQGLALVRAYLRRLIILLALELEWNLVDTRGPMKRPHGRKATSPSGPNLTCLDNGHISPWEKGVKVTFKDKPKPALENRRRPGAPVYVQMNKLYAQLNYLAKLVTNPMPKAQRLAFHLRRSRPYIRPDHATPRPPPHSRRLGARH
jgi:hypothetical protein